MGGRAHFYFAKVLVDKAALITDVERILADGLPGAEVVDVEVAGSGGSRIMRVFIDRPEGVDHELCARATSLLAKYHDDYALEVSSPGLERRLRKPEHFLEAVGKKINVRTYGPVEGQRNFTGFLVSAEGGSLRLDIDGHETAVPLDDVASVKLVFDFGGKEKPRGGKKRRTR